MNVLMLGRNLMMMEIGADPIKQAGHTLTLTTEDNVAKIYLKDGSFDALIFGMAVEHTSREDLKAYIATHAPSVRVLEPEGLADLPQLLAGLV